MFFFIATIVLFVIISIYFFFQAEKLQRQLIAYKRESSNIRKENKALVDSIALVANRGQEFAKARLKKLQEHASTNESEQLMLHVVLITPLINNYSIIFSECLKGSGRLKKVSQKCFENQDNSAYKKFVALIVTSDKQLKRYWSSDNLNGFLFLVDGLLAVDNNMKELSNPPKNVRTH